MFENKFKFVTDILVILFNSDEVGIASVLNLFLRHFLENILQSKSSRILNY